MNEYIDKEDDASSVRDGGDSTTYALDIQQSPYLIEWRHGSSGKFILTTEIAFESLHNRSSPIHHDLVIDDSEDEPIMAEDNADEWPRVIEFSQGQTFYGGYCLEALKEFDYEWFWVYIY